jgi:predicted DNA-binding ribbon-helix-helix protein
MQLDLEEKEVQQILNTLAQQPYASVAQLIAKIINQTNDADPDDQ